MTVVSFTEARNKLKNIFDIAYNDNEEVIIHRHNSQSVVMISLDEYNSLKETNYLLSNENNRKRVLNSLKQLRAGNGQERSLIETNLE